MPEILQSPEAPKNFTVNDVMESEIERYAEARYDVDVTRLEELDDILAKNTSVTDITKEQAIDLQKLISDYVSADYAPEALEAITNYLKSTETVN